ncbi:MAG TPA: HEPN domain-containing protein [Candidatus Paceibacterota bacterium]|nr:HEPN domain-containing protein [Caldisericia bacterium]HON22119.1 HEPN domain-containing protein [Candidatus Paceibacterota bacterium]HPC37640.1 HEPN domain-containing protein [Candidatus Paceibacterota bacterium]
MNLDELLNKLLKEGKIKKQDASTDYLNGLLEAAQRNFLAAKYNLKNNFPEIAFKAAYDGMLQISRAILLSNGFRPDDGEQHKTTFLVAGMLIGQDIEDLIGRIDRYRIKRNQAVYQPRGLLSASEAEGIITTAEEYWKVAKNYLKKKNNQLELFDF